MSTISNTRLRKQPSPHSRFKNFRLWIKGAFQRTKKEKQPMITVQDAQHLERSVKRLPSTARRVPSKRSIPNVKRRRSQRHHHPSSNRSSKSSNSNSKSVSRSSLVSINDNDNVNDKDNDNDKKENLITIKDVEDKNHKDDNDNNDNDNDNTDSWINKEILNKKDDELISSSIDSTLLGSDIYEGPTVISICTSTVISSCTPTVTSSCNSTITSSCTSTVTSSCTSTVTPTTVIPSCTSTSDKDHRKQQLSDDDSSDDDSSDDSKENFLENTRIVKGSVEHFAYARTLRKLHRKDKQRSMCQSLLLNNILAYLSSPQLQFSDEIRKMLNHYKKIFYESNRKNRSSVNNNNNNNKDRSSSSNFNDSALSSCSSLVTNRKLSAILAGIHPVSPISMKYRPSYASSKVVMIFDEELDQLVVKELPMARRRRRLSDLSILNRSTTSPTTSTNSSQSSLVTLTDEAEIEPNKYSPITTKESETFLSNPVVIQNDNDGSCDEEDDVPLFVLKEQFRYSGRSYVLLKNNVSSIEENGPSRITLAV